MTENPWRTVLKKQTPGRLPCGCIIHRDPDNLKSPIVETIYLCNKHRPKKNRAPYPVKVAR